MTKSARNFRAVRHADLDVRHSRMSAHVTFEMLGRLPDRAGRAEKLRESVHEADVPTVRVNDHLR